VVSLSRRRAIVACAIALVAALLTVPALASQGTPESATNTVQTPERYRAAYARWRERLERHDLFLGRNLLAEVHTAGASASAPSALELRRSIWRMQRRWSRWLNTTEDGRSFTFKLKLRQVPAWGQAQLRSIAACESHDNPRAVGGGGAYRGLYQFSSSTWRVVSGRGDPAAAPRSEQTWRAWLLLSRHGSGHWPVCG
jgi:Transglycosylase-like domain